jgi:hypothetical protein
VRTLPFPVPALVALLCVGALALGSAACGGEEEGPTVPATAPMAPEGVDRESRDKSGEVAGRPAAESLPPPTRGQVRAVIEAFVTSTDPAVACDAVVTEQLLERAFGDRRGCREALAPQAVADRVEVRAVRIVNGSATAIAIPRGGVNDGVEVEVELVEDNGALAIDRFEADVAPGP